MTHPIDGTPPSHTSDQYPHSDIPKVTYRDREAAPEKPPWPDDPTRDNLPPLTAPLVEQYVTRIRLMEEALKKALDQVQKACGPDEVSIRMLYHFRGCYKGTLHALLEEAGLDPLKEQS